MNIRVKNMIKLLLALYLILGLTACRERRGPEPQYLPPQEYGQDTVEKSITESQEEIVTTEEVSLIEIPILEDTLPTPEKAVNNVSYGSIQTFTGGHINDGLDIKNIRSSQSTERTRLVFDTYIDANNMAEQSGQYTFTYYPKQKRISAVLHGYRKFSALGTKKERYFKNSSLIEKLNLVKYKDDSGFKLNITLLQDVSVNVFELKNPARIVIDVTPR